MQRQGDGEGASSSRLALDAYFTTMRFNDLFDDGQPQPSAMMLAPLAGWIGLVEAFEDVRQGLGRDACAGIRYLHLHAVLYRDGLQGDVSARAGEFEGVLEQVGEDLG